MIYSEDELYNSKTQEEKEAELNKVKEIAYYRPNFWKRCFALLYDAIIFLILTVFVFIGLRAIVVNNGHYKELDDELVSYKLESGLYIRSTERNRVEDIGTYYNLDTSGSTLFKLNDIEEKLDTFFTFMKNNVDEETYKEICDFYDEYRLQDSFKYNGFAYFFEDDEGNIVRNDGHSIPYRLYIDDVYLTYIDRVALGLFDTKIPRIVEIEKYQSYMLIFLEIPVSIVIAHILVYFVAPLIFRRGRKTLGRLAFKTGLVDKNVLNVSFKLFLLRYVIILFSEVLLSLVTLGIPLIISFTMMVFSKKKQTFHDYMLGIEEVDTDEGKIYYSKLEIEEETPEEIKKGFKLR